MKDKLEKILAWSYSIAGVVGTFAGIGLIQKDPKEIIGYSGAVASACLSSYGIRELKKIYGDKK